jgi:molecular chaperone GrpE
MNPNHESEKLDDLVDDNGSEESESVDDFIKQLEEREKDLHITADTTIIEIAEAFEGGELPDFMKGEFDFAPASPVAAAAAPEKSEAPTPNAQSAGKLEKEIATLKEKIAVLEADRDELKKSTQRRAKDFDNYKSRTERERAETFQNKFGNLAMQMVPALDNLNRAVDFAFAMPEDTRSEVQPFVDGIVLVNQQVNEVLAEMGVQPIATVGETFDPHFHEAVATEESDDYDPNTISAELLRGYRIGDRVVRHSMVRVVKGPAPRATTETEPPTYEDESLPDAHEDAPQDLTNSQSSETDEPGEE